MLNSFINVKRVRNSYSIIEAANTLPSEVKEQHYIWKSAQEAIQKLSRHIRKPISLAILLS